MSSDAAVELVDVSKRYELGELASLGHTIHALGARLRRRELEHSVLEAVTDVTFTVERGECFTIVGANGSGKSTLSKIIAGITLPTSGEVRLRGRVLPLLNVGSGFHLDLTGRENVVVLGTILGLSRQEIERAIPQVAEFAGIAEKHMDTPVKRFSEGMSARLSFATAMRFPADVYIFDEVLVTADDEFKRLCAAEIREVAKGGAAVVFISHELPLVRAMCTRGMWLHRGRVECLGPIDEVASAYARFEQGAAAR